MIRSTYRVKLRLNWINSASHLSSVAKYSSNYPEFVLPHLLPSEPSVRVRICTRVSEVDEWISSTGILEKPVPVGIDCEWKPNAYPNGKTKVALLQLSTMTDVMLVHMLMLKGVSRQLKALLLSRDIAKVGVEVESDLRKMLEDYGYPYGRFVDVSASYTRITDGHSGGLATIFREVIGHDLDKNRSVTMSNWERYPLDHAQVSYAAYDALAGVCIYHELRRLAAHSMSLCDSEDNSRYKSYSFYVGEDNHDMIATHRQRIYPSETHSNSVEGSIDNSISDINNSDISSSLSNLVSIIDNRADNLTPAQAQFQNLITGSEEYKPVYLAHAPTMTSTPNAAAVPPMFQCTRKFSVLYDKAALRRRIRGLFRESLVTRSRLNEVLWFSDKTWIEMNASLLANPKRVVVQREETEIEEDREEVVLLQGIPWEQALDRFISRLGWVVRYCKIPNNGNISSHSSSTDNNASGINLSSSADVQPKDENGTICDPIKEPEGSSCNDNIMGCIEIGREVHTLTEEINYIRIYKSNSISYFKLSYASKQMLEELVALQRDMSPQRLHHCYLAIDPDLSEFISYFRSKQI